LDGQTARFEGHPGQIDFLRFTGNDPGNFLVGTHGFQVGGLAEEKSIGGKVGHLLITIDIGEGDEVTKVENIQVQLFLDLPLQGFFEGFSVTHKPSGKVIVSPFRRPASLD
jgi:hypothetical protein